MSEAFVASRVCLQVASMVAFVDGFFAMSTHALRVWSICVLYIARCASGTLETMQASYLVRKSSQGDYPRALRVGRGDAREQGYARRE